MRLDEDVTKMRPKHAPAIVLQDDLVERSGASLQPVLALVPGAAEDEILTRSAAVAAEFDRESRRREGTLAAVLGPSRLVPPPERQVAALERLRSLRAAGAIDPARVEALLLAALERHGFKVDGTARRAAARVRRMLERDRPISWEEARTSALGPVLDDFMVTLADGRRMGVVSAYPRPQLSSNVIIPALKAAAAASGAPLELAGARVLSQEIRPLILRDGIVSTIVSAVGIIGILALVFRRVGPAMLTAVPLAVGLFASLGLMAAGGIDFNLVTVSMLPLVIGIAIDNGIHVVHRYLEGGERDVADVLRHTGRGVVMASLTTVVGFGALLFADYPGLVSSGVLAMLGTGLAMVASVTLLPALLVLVRKR
jgi:predicted exporter